MLIDHRTYTVRAGTLRKQLALYEKHGLAHQKRHFGEPLAWLVSETGDVNSYVHIWVYEDAADRNAQARGAVQGPGMAEVHRDERGGRLPDQAGKQADVARAVRADQAVTVGQIKSGRVTGSVSRSRLWLAACVSASRHAGRCRRRSFRRGP